MPDLTQAELAEKFAQLNLTPVKLGYLPPEWVGMTLGFCIGRYKTDQAINIGYNVAHHLVVWQDTTQPGWKWFGALSNGAFVITHHRVEGVWTELQTAVVTWILENPNIHTPPFL